MPLRVPSISASAASVGRWRYVVLDEIEMPLEAQAKLLRVLRDGLVDRVGGAKAVPVDVRVIAATNADCRWPFSRGGSGAICIIG